MRCYNGGNKHKFEARYEECPNNIKLTHVKGYGDLRELFYYKKYVYDICVWCGKIVKEK